MPDDRSPRDPLEALRLPALPLAPDPTFAARLRTRLAAELRPTDPEGAAMTITTLADVPQASPQEVPVPVGVVPYASVPDGEAAIVWYARALGARLGGDPIVMEDGRIGHAELVVNGGVFYLAAAFPEYGFNAPVLGELPPVTMHLTVSDVDALVDHAVGEGATLERPPTDNPYGRGGTFIDPFGHRWIVHQDVTTATSVDGESASADRSPINGERQGDISYLTLMVPDSGRARAFYGSVLGWAFNPGRVDDGWEVVGVQPMTGMWGGDAVEVPTMVPMYRVDDIGSAVDRVRAAGGTATDPEQVSYGWSSECVDDQDAHFYLGQL